MTTVTKIVNTLRKSFLGRWRKLLIKLSKNSFRKMLNFLKKNQTNFFDNILSLASF